MHCGMLAGYASRIVFYFVAVWCSCILGERDILDPMKEAPQDSESTFSMLSLRSRQQLYGYQHSGGPLVQFPKALLSKFPHPQYLGTGSFGESWLVQAPKGMNRSAVVKLFYVRDPQHLNRPRSLVASDTQRYINEMDSAKKECTIEKKLTRRSDENIDGASKIMNCFGHNIDSARGPDPIYLVLEYCGRTDLTKFMIQQVQGGKWNSRMVGMLFQQLLVGLQHLASFAPPWIHHDLKPDNLVVKDTQGRYSLYLIDFGCTVQATPGNECRITGTTPAFAPFEFSKQLPGSRCKLNYSPSSPQTFDLFAAGAILVQMIVGKYMVEAIPTVSMRGQFGAECNHDRLQQQISAPGRLLRSLKAARGYENVLASFLAGDSAENKFFKEAIKLLSKNPRERPSAQALLKLDFMKESLKQKE